MKKLTILALTAVASAAFIFTGCPHTADDFKEGETFDLVKLDSATELKWSQVAIPGKAFDNMTTTNNAQRVTVEYELTAEYPFVQFFIGEWQAGNGYTGKYYNGADDTVLSTNDDGFVVSADAKTSVYIIPSESDINTFKEKGLIVAGNQIKVTKVTATYIGEAAEAETIVEKNIKDFGDTTATFTGGTVTEVVDASTLETISVLKIKGTNGWKVDKSINYSGPVDLSSIKKATIEYRTVGIKGASATGDDNWMGEGNFYTGLIFKDKDGNLSKMSICPSVSSDSEMDYKKLELTDFSALSKVEIKDSTLIEKAEELSEKAKEADLKTISSILLIDSFSGSLYIKSITFE